MGGLSGAARHMALECRWPRLKGRPLNNLRNLALWIVVALLLVFLFNLFQGTANHQSASAINYTKFRPKVLTGDVKEVSVQGEVYKGSLGNGTAFTTVVPSSDTTIIPLMNAHNVNV